jgi:hypothetical protein
MIAVCSNYHFFYDISESSQSPESNDSNNTMVLIEGTGIIWKELQSLFAQCLVCTNVVPRPLRMAHNCSSYAVASSSEAFLALRQACSPHSFAKGEHLETGIRIDIFNCLFWKCLACGRVVSNHSRDHHTCTYAVLAALCLNVRPWHTAFIIYYKRPIYSDDPMMCSTRATGCRCFIMLIMSRVVELNYCPSLILMWFWCDT